MTKSTVAEEYDRLVDHFARWRPSERMRRIFELLVLGFIRRRSKPLSVLDAGCGHGTWLECLLGSPAVGELHLVGIDLSERRIAKAQSTLKDRPNVKVVCGDLLTTPLPDPLDLIYAVEVFQHLQVEQQRQLLELWRPLLRPGGSIIIIDKDARSWHAFKIEMQKRTGQIGRWLWGRYRLFGTDFARLFATIHYPSFQELERMGREMGLQVHPCVRVGEFSGLELSAAEGNSC